MKFHQLASVDWHFAMDDWHLFGRKWAALLKLASKRSKDLRVYATESFCIVMWDGALYLFVSCLVLKDCQQCSLCPTLICCEFCLESFERFSLIHNENDLLDSLGTAQRSLSWMKSPLFSSIITSRTAVQYSCHCWRVHSPFSNLIRLV